MANLEQQLILGVSTWILLIFFLCWETNLVRIQVAVVVLFATVIEYLFSATLHVYIYRLHNVPAFVPPGHGLIYLGALALGRTRLFDAHKVLLMMATLVLGGAYAWWGLVNPHRPDVLGFFWFICLILFLLYGKSPLLYVGAFLIVTYLELLGTHWRIWTWQTYDPTGWVSMGNPPSGVAGGYAWFDAAAWFLASKITSPKNELQRT